MNHELLITPFEHQLEGIAATLKNVSGFANFAETGTGKTLMKIGALNILRSRGEVNKVLIVCPKTLKYVWADEFKHSRLAWNIVILDGPIAHRAKEIGWQKKPHTVLITNYDSITKLVPALNQWSPDLIICDECQAIKSPKAKRTKALKQIATQRKWAMTGTPVVKNVLDVWSIMDWIRPGHLFNNYYAFRNRYCNIYTGAGFPMITSFKNLDELKSKVDVYSWRKLKEECLDLPDKVWQQVDFELEAPEREAYKQMAEEMIAEIGDQEIVASTALVRTLRLQQLTSGYLQNDKKEVVRVGNSKLDVLADLLDDLQGQKVVIWTRFREDVAAIAALCKKLKRSWYTITGADSAEMRMKNITSFQTSTYDDVMIGNIAAGGAGITLTASSHVIYFSHSWSLGDRLQSQDRTHRIGQKNKVTYYDLCAIKTIDSHILKVLKGKQHLSDILTGDKLRRIVYDLD